MLRRPLEATGGYDFGPIFAIAIDVSVGSFLLIALVIGPIWRFAGGARWPLSGGPWALVDPQLFRAVFGFPTRPSYGTPK